MLRRAFLFLAFGLIACGGGDGPPGSSPDAAAPDAFPSDAAPCDPTVRTFSVPDFSQPINVMHVAVAPTDIDPASLAYPESIHQLYVADDPSVTPRDELFVMLPGTNNRAQGFEHIALIAARAGYPVISLAYESATNQAGLCAGAGDEQAIADCRAAVVAEKVYGIDMTPEYPGDEPNSIAGRLRRLLQYVDANYPTAGAGRFFDGDTIVWSKIVVAGFSQGSIMAGYISKEESVARAVLLAGGCDSEMVGDQAVLMPWCSEPRATPAERTFALTHTMDEPEEDTAIIAAYGLAALGGYGDAAHGAPGYCTSPHALTTDLRSQGGGNNYHLSLAHDGDLPTDTNDVPLLAEDYYYLMTAE